MEKVWDAGQVKVPNSPRSTGQRKGSRQVTQQVVPGLADGVELLGRDHASTDGARLLRKGTDAPQSGPPAHGLRTTSTFKKIATSNIMNVEITF